MKQTLVIFSGLPGVGKSTLAERLAAELKWPLLGVDQVTEFMRPYMKDGMDWDAIVQILLDLVESQVRFGLNVIVDSVFMNFDRLHAQELARKYSAGFRPVYVHVSDEAIWRERVTKRFESSPPEWDVADWEQIQHQRAMFAEWQPDSALFLDSLLPADENYQRILDYVKSENVSLKPMEVKSELVRGRYHH